MRLPGLSGWLIGELRVMKSLLIGVGTAREGTRHQAACKGF